jgi:L-fuculose-phosphate aldolase
MPLSKLEQQYREDIVRIGRMMFDKGWVASNDGNISIRMGSDRILATPAGVSKGALQPEDMIVCDREGVQISGSGKPTSELQMHLTIYDNRPDVGAVTHAHPPVATGFAVAGRPLNMGILPEVIVALGAVPLADYSLPGTPALSETMLPYLANYDAMLLSNHGVVTYASDAQRAFFLLDTVEHTARITLVAELLGGAKPLPRIEIQKLFEARGRYGAASRNHYEPGWPMAAEDMPDSSEKIVTTRDELLQIIDEALKVRGGY